MGKSQGNPTLCTSHTDSAKVSSPVQSFHNSTAKFRVHTSVTSLIYSSDERHFSWYSFLKRLEMSSFFLAGNGLTNASVNGALILFGLQLCGCGVLFGKLQRDFFLLCVFHACAEHFQEQICIFLSFVPAQPIQK